jgi:hypothetical protein
MNARKVRDIMVPLSEYPIVDASATVLEAVIRLDESRRTAGADRQPYLAVLVADRDGNIVGKLGQLGILQALELRGHVAKDQDTLDKAGVSDSMMQTAMDHYRVLQREVSDLCLGATGTPVRDVMHPIKEHIDIEAPICEVIHQIVVWQTLSVLVTEKGRPVGLIRLADLCDEVIKQMRRTPAGADAED